MGLIRAENADSVVYYVDGVGDDEDYKLVWNCWIKISRFPERGRGPTEVNFWPF